MKSTVYNKNLNPVFWDKKQRLHPKIETALKKITAVFNTDVKLTVPIYDIHLLGSSANYNWNPTSDVDLHILVDLNDFEMPFDSAKQYVSALAKKWNSDHEIFIKKHKVELYIQHITEENRSTGIYSILKGDWVLKPVHQRVMLDKEAIQILYTLWANKIKKAIASENSHTVNATMKSLSDMRNVGLGESGEFSAENIVFKVLRQRGIITKLADAIKSIADKELSIKDGFDPTSFGPNSTSPTMTPMSDPGFYKRTNNAMRTGVADMQ